MVRYGVICELAEVHARRRVTDVVNEVQGALRNLNRILCEHHSVCELTEWGVSDGCSCDVVVASLVFREGCDVGVFCVLVCLWQWQRTGVAAVF